MARHIPPSRVNWNRNHRTISAKVTVEEYERVRDNASTAGVTLSGWVAIAALGEGAEEMRRAAFVEQCRQGLLHVFRVKEESLDKALRTAGASGLDALVQTIRVLCQGNPVPFFKLLYELMPVLRGWWIERTREETRLRYCIAIPCVDCHKPIELTADMQEADWIRDQLASRRYAHHRCPE